MSTLRVLKNHGLEWDVQSCQMDGLMEGLVPYLISLYLLHTQPCFQNQ